MTQFTKTGELIHDWKPSNPPLKFRYVSELLQPEHDRFLAAFGNINRSEFIRKLLMKAIREKEAEKQSALNAINSFPDAETD